jgi:hypothetical protein
MSKENFFLDPELHKGWAEGCGDLFWLSLTIAQESAEFSKKARSMLLALFVLASG